MKFIIAPDSFKGSLSAQAFCNVAENAIKKHFPEAEISSMPLADGGEGTLDCINSALCGILKEYDVTGPFFDCQVKAKVGFFEEGQTAVVESAMAMGLPLAGERKNPEFTTTFGVGQMILQAISEGAKKIILALGGSSTNDCGAGMICALGGKFYDSKGNAFIPTGATLIKVDSADFSKLYSTIDKVEFTAMCDVINPLCGEKGCSAVFGPQKGADEKMVLRLDEGCHHFSQIVQKTLEKDQEKSLPDFENIAGSGAAGGLGFACVSVLNGILKSGIQTVLQLYNFSNEIKNCDYIFTGEGKFDSQSMMGKTVGGIVNANILSVPLVIFCGIGEIENPGTPIESVNQISAGYPLEYALNNSEKLLEESIHKWLKKKETKI